MSPPQGRPCPTCSGRGSFYVGPPMTGPRVWFACDDGGARSDGRIPCDYAEGILIGQMPPRNCPKCGWGYLKLASVEVAQ